MTSAKTIATATTVATMLAGGAGACTDERYLTPIDLGSSSDAATSSGADAFSFAADAGPDPVQPLGSSEWSLVVGEDGRNFIEAIGLAPNGDVVAAGVLSPGAEVGGQAIEMADRSSAVLRLSDDGDLVWAHVIEGGFGMRTVDVDGEGAVVAAGDDLLVRIDASGKLDWRLELPRVLRDIAVAASPEGDIAVAGRFYEYRDGEDVEDLYLASVSRDGQLLWSQEFGDKPGNYWGTASDSVALTFTSGGDIAIASKYFWRISVGGLSIESDSREEEGFVAVVAPDGEGRWIDAIAHDFASAAVDVVAAPDGTVYAALALRPEDTREFFDHVVRHYDSSGETRRDIELPTMRGLVKGMAVTDDGSIILAGHFGRGIVYGTIMFLKRLAPNGDLVGEHFVEDYVSASHRAVAARGERLVAGGGFLSDTGPEPSSGRLDAFRLLTID